jgi:hypothetical protein
MGGILRMGVGFCAEGVGAVFGVVLWEYLVFLPPVFGVSVVIGLLAKRNPNTVGKKTIPFQLN